MRRVLAIGMSLMLAIANSYAGTANGVFTVQVTMGGASSSICTSASGSTAGSSSVQVQCNANVYVSIAQVNTPASRPFQVNGGFITSLRPVRDTPLPDYCRRELSGLADQAARAACGSTSAAGPFDDSVAEADQGWSVESQLYATGPDAAPLQSQTLARLRLDDNRGTLTALRVERGNGGFEAVEMLVSF